MIHSTRRSATSRRGNVLTSGTSRRLSHCLPELLHCGLVDREHRLVPVLWHGADAACLDEVIWRGPACRREPGEGRADRLRTSPHQDDTAPATWMARGAHQ